MRPSAVMSLVSISLAIVLAPPGHAYGQEATVTGTVTDLTGGVLPGVTVTAVHEASGNTFAVTTDEHGGYRLSARAGTYRVTAELSGFGTVTQAALSWGRACGTPRATEATSGTWGVGGTARLRPNGTIVPRNDLVGKSIQGVDLRVQRRFALGGPAVIDGIVEVYNLLNHENFGSYTTQESNARYGQPSDNTNQAYQSRRVQLGFRAAF